MEPDPRRLVELRGQRREPLGGRGVVALDRGRTGQQRRRGDLLDVPRRDDRVAVAGEDDLALLGELEPAVDRARGLRQERAVGGAAPAPERAAAAVEQGQHDLVASRPLGDPALRGVQRERGGDGADVLGRVRVAEHDLDAAPVLREPALHLREQERALEDVDAGLEVRERLEQRDRVDDRRVHARERDLRQLVDGREVLGGLRERDDVAAGGQHAVAPLDGPDGAERVDDLDRAGLEGAVDAVRAQVRQRTLVHLRVLPHLELGQVEPERLHLPDQPLQLAVRRRGWRRPRPASAAPRRGRPRTRGAAPYARSAFRVRVAAMRSARK